MGRQIDAVLEHDDGRVVGAELQAAATVTPDDFGHLAVVERRLGERRLGERFHRGVVLYAGERVVPFGERLTAVPIATLWNTAAPR